MDIFKDFELKRQKYMPTFPKAIGKPTTYIEGYPSEDDEPMCATGFHAEQITTLSDQLKRYFSGDNLVYIGVDSFIYYREGDMTKFVGPDIYVVLGASPYPQRRSFYTWAEGVLPTVIFEFLSDSTAAYDRGDKVKRYIIDIGVQEYFIHQPEGDKPSEFRGWCRSPAGDIEEIIPDTDGGLFSRALNLWLYWMVQQPMNVRLLRPYLPDGTPIPTSSEEQEGREQAEALVKDMVQRLQQAETLVEAEAQRRQNAEAIAEAEAQRRQELEAELERLRAQLATSQSDKSE